MNINMRDICVTLGKSDILKNVNLDIEDGKVIGIVGPNGSGKSTLIKTIQGIVKMQEGSISLNGDDIKKISKKELSTMVGYVGQNVDCIFDFKVKDVIAMALYPNRYKKRKKKAAEIIDDALKELSIEHLKERSILTLSGGEKKMVFLARVIAQDVETIILDEPTNHLDVNYQLFILNYLKNSGKTILIVLHDLQLATYFCDKILVMKNGSDVSFGEPQEVLTEETIKEVFNVHGKVKNKDGKNHFILGMDLI